MENKKPYMIKKVKYGLRSPSLAIRKGIQISNKIRHGDYYQCGVDVVNEDWDNLIILDGCRYDLFNNTCSQKGKLSKKTSRGSATPEWLRGNFRNENLTDTVYISGNPMLQFWLEELNVNFHHIEQVWENGWSEDKGTVLPTTMKNRTMKIQEEFPQKRLIIHFIQPHYPFLGVRADFNKMGFDEDQTAPFWLRIKTGELKIEQEEIWEMYKNNLNKVLPEVDYLASTLPGKTVTTSDHGNLLGERITPLKIPEWGHPPGVYEPQLLTVPWFEHPINGNRKKIKIGEPNEAELSTDTEDRLKKLGYI